MSVEVELLEYTQVTKARKIDEEAGVLYDLAALGPSSANGRDYPEETQRRALPLLEGRQSFANHTKSGSGEPSVYDVLGVWRDLYVKEGKTYGNFHYFKTHRLAPTLVEAARRPELNTALGFSISARGKTSHRNGREVVESLTSVSSIDCVAQPATVAGMYESRSNPVKKKVTELHEQLKKSRPEYARALKEMAEAGVMSPGAMMDEPAGDAMATDHRQALKDACKAVLDDESLSEEEMIQKIKKILKIINGGSKGGDVPDFGGDDDAADDDGEDKGKKEESKKEAAELAQLRTEKRVRVAAEKAGVKVTAALLESLRPDITDEQIKALLAQPTPGAGRPGARSAPGLPKALTPAGKGKDSTVTESKKEEKVPEDRAALGKWLSGR